MNKKSFLLDVLCGKPRGEGATRHSHTSFIFQPESFLHKGRLFFYRKLPMKNVPHTDDAEDEEREKEEEVEKGVGVAAGRRKAAAEGKVQATPRYAIAIRNTGRGTTGFCDPRANNILRYCMLADLKL